MNHTLVKRSYNPSIKDFLEYIASNPHENFPAIAEVCDDFYVMEYISGKTLLETVSQELYTSSSAKDYILQLIDAVSILHKFSIVHRDIKPENIIITKDGTLKLIDFDISRKITDKKSRDTDILGTVGYAAPEQFGFAQTDARSDIYAIGTVYNFMLTGKLPIEEIPGGQVGKIIKKCTAINQSARYKDLKTLRRDVSKERFTSYKLLDIIPGFRTRNIYKMTIAVFCYLVFVLGYFALAFTEGPRENPEDILLFYLIYTLLIAYNFLFFSIGTNFLNFTDQIKIPIKNKIAKTTVLLAICYVFGCIINIAFQESFIEGVLYNPINATLMLFGYFLYSMVDSFLIGMQ